MNNLFLFVMGWVILTCYPLFSDPSTLMMSSPSPVHTLKQHIESLEKEVETVRALRFVHSLTLQTVSPQIMKTKIEKEVVLMRSSQALHGWEALLKYLHVIDSSFSLAHWYQRVMGEQLLGYYDSNTQTLRVLSEDIPLKSHPSRFQWGRQLGLTSFEAQWVHELTHALEDQHFHWDTLDQKATTQDQQWALSALREGTAMFTTLLYAAQKRIKKLNASPTAQNSSLRSKRIRQYIREALNRLPHRGEKTGYPILDQSPAFLRDILLFPYTEGVKFIARVYQVKGWDGVNALFENVPRSTREILQGRNFSTPPKSKLFPCSFSTAFVHNLEQTYSLERIYQGTLGVLGLFEILQAGEIHSLEKEGGKTLSKSQEAGWLRSTRNDGQNRMDGQRLPETPIDPWLLDGWGGDQFFLYREPREENLSRGERNNPSRFSSPDKYLVLWLTCWTSGKFQSIFQSTLRQSLFFHSCIDQEEAKKLAPSPSHQCLEIGRKGKRGNRLTLVNTSNPVLYQYVTTHLPK